MKRTKQAYLIFIFLFVLNLKLNVLPSLDDFINHQEISEQVVDLSQSKTGTCENKSKFVEDVKKEITQQHIVDQPPVKEGVEPHYEKKNNKDKNYDDYYDVASDPVFMYLV